MITQHVRSRLRWLALEKEEQKRWSLLKINVKNGGIDRTISAAIAALTGGATQQDINGRLFACKMFLRFELPPAGVQNLYNRPG